MGGKSFLSLTEICRYRPMCGVFVCTDDFFYLGNCPSVTICLYRGEGLRIRAVLTNYRYTKLAVSITGTEKIPIRTSRKKRTLFLDDRKATHNIHCRVLSIMFVNSLGQIIIEILAPDHPSPTYAHSHIHTYSHPSSTIVLGCRQ